MSVTARSREAWSASLFGSLQRLYGGSLRAAMQDTQPMAYVEATVGLGVLSLLNVLFFRDDWGYFDVNPHPFWFVVIPVAARYGAVPGYFVGGLAALLYVMFIVFQPRSVFVVDILSTQAILPPVLFLVGGAALGELRESQKRAHKALAAQHDAMEKDLEDVAQRYLAAVEINREMQRRIVAQTSTVTTLYQAAKALDQLEVEQLVPAVLELVTTFVEAESCALYLRQENRFVLHVGRPEQPDFARPTVLTTNAGMLARVVSEHRTMTVRDVLPEATPNQIARERLLIATPLIGTNQDVIGVLTVEKMPFLRFTPSAVKLFGLLGDWASSAFQTALRFQQTRDRNIEDERTGAYSYAYVKKRLGEEVARGKAYGIPLGLIALRIDDYVSIPPVKLPSVLQTMALVFRRYIRELDVLGKYATDDIFLIALPHVAPDDARVLADRIAREIAQFGFRPFDNDQTLTVSAAVAASTARMSNPQELIDAAIQALPAGQPSASGRAVP